MHFSGFKDDKVPLKYLSMRVSSKKLTVDDCQYLIDKVVSGIRTWGSRTISYAGRAQLVNSVLLSLHV